MCESSRGLSKGVKVVLGPGDPMEEANKFMQDGIFMGKEDFFDGMEDDRSFEDGGIE